MEWTSDTIRAALRQQLLTDAMLGVVSVPIRPPKPPPRAGRGATGAATQPLPKAGDAGRSAASKQQLLAEINERSVQACTQCRLHETRTKTVFGQGNPDARIVFVGEAPGFEEDRSGLAFVGRAGDLLTRIIEKAMGLSRDDVYICNTVKCRPPGNRDPRADEILSCSPYLRQQLTIIQPEVVVALGAPAAKTLLNTTQSIGKLRGRFHEYYFSGTTGVGPCVALMPTYHPAYLLRTPSEKAKTWEDIKMVLAKLGLKEPR
ncbi:MAG: uracil-DNA glycosylase [Phycisphaerae bacterium]